jgi:hypothetical protein
LSRPKITPAASLLPPPRPPASGVLLSIKISMLPEIPVYEKKALAADRYKKSQPVPPATVVLVYSKLKLNYGR